MAKRQGATSAETSAKPLKNKGHANIIPGAKDPRTITSEQKKAGWDRKRQALKMLDTIQMHQNMTAAELNEYIREKEKTGTLTIFEANLAQYTKRQQTDKDMFKHWVEKHIPNAPQRTELEHSGYVGQDTLTGSETPQELEKMRKALLM